MDAFFASVELLRYPQLRGLPVVIGGGRRPVSASGSEDSAASEDPANWPISQFQRLGDYTGRGVITTATYAARAYGLGSAMGMMKAAALCPDAIMLPVDHERYRDYAARFKAVILEIAPVMENRGIDEVYIDLTHVPGGQREGGRVIARLLQKEIFHATGLSCSIGVAPNKLLAKMASELDKPNGISILSEADIALRIWPLPCRAMNGIGPKSDAKLKALGIQTLGELAACDEQWLIDHFGNSYGRWLHLASHGEDDRPVVTHSEPLSISRETTFEKDLHAKRDREQLSDIFTRLCTKLAEDLARKAYAARSVGIKLRDNQFKTITRDVSLPHAIRSASDIRHHAGQALKRATLDKPLRLLGVKLGKLVVWSEEAERAGIQARHASQPPVTGDLFSDDS